MESRDKYGPRNISGSTSGAGFGRAGTPRDVKYIKHEDDTKETTESADSTTINRNRRNISGATSGAGFGRAGTPRGVDYIGG